MNWNPIRLVVFDVDGTLYDQCALRHRMLAHLVRHTLVTHSLTAVRILRNYRALRERIGDEELEGFEDIVLVRTAQKSGVDKATVLAVVNEWMNHRPLAHLRACCYPHVADLFLALKANAKMIGIFSDYPAQDKLRALDLDADFIVSAADKDIGLLKPHPRGLVAIMASAGVTPQETLMIGDRVERDGEAARRIGVASLIRSPRQIAGWTCFADYAAPLFQPLRNSRSAPA